MEELVKGLISIQASMMRDSLIRTTQLLRFIKWWQRYGCFENVVYPYLRDIRNAKEGKPSLSLETIKINLIEAIVCECIDNKDIRVDLQKTFGQFDGAQICECCGDIITEGYSWLGATYCSLPCVLNAECLYEEEAEKCLEDADNPAGDYYYTDWI